MVFQFLRTKIGLSVIVALLLVGGAVILKVRTYDSGNALETKVGLIADASVEKGIENGDIALEDWQKTLGLFSASSTDDKIASLGGTESSTPENLTATDRFSREFLTEYVKLKGSSAVIDENTGTELVNQLLSRDYGGGDEEKTYTEKDIKILTTTSLSALKKYGNDLGSIVNPPLPNGYEQELIILDRVNDGGDKDDLKKLSLNIARYQAIRNNIVALPVPNALKNAHLALINSLSALLDGVKGMTLIETDPVASTKMIAHYEEGLALLPVSIQTMGAYFARQNVTFSTNEPGYILTR